MTVETRPLGWATHLCDLLTIVCGGAALVLLVAGPYREVIGGTLVSLRWTHAAFVAVALGAIRHAAVPSPSLAVRVASWSDHFSRRPALADALLAFWLTRPTVLIIGLLAVATFGLASEADPPVADRYMLRELPARFDANWYAGIALDGYEWQHRFDRQQNLAFFPAYPLLMRAGGLITGAFGIGLSRERRIVRLAWAGVAISLVAFLWACWYFARLARELLDAPRARLAVLLLATYPFAVFFSAAYTEALFLLAALGTWFHLRRGEAVRCALWGLLAGLTRPNGFLLSVPLGLIALGVRDAAPDGEPRRAVFDRLLLAMTPAVGALLFTGYLYHRTGVWFAWMRMHGAWGRVFSSDSPGAVAGLLSSDGLWRVAVGHPYDTLNAFGVVFALALVWPVWRRVSPAWAGYVIVMVVPPLFAGGLLSMGRLSSTLFPLFLALAALLPSRLAPGVAGVFGMVQGFIAALFFTWRALY